MVYGDFEFCLVEVIPDPALLWRWRGLGERDFSPGRPPFSQSARSRYNCPRVRISRSSEVTRAAYSQTALSGPISANVSRGCAGFACSVIARSRASLRRSRMTRRWRLQPSSRSVVSLPCHLGRHRPSRSAASRVRGLVSHSPSCAGGTDTPDHFARPAPSLSRCPTTCRRAAGLGGGQAPNGRAISTGHRLHVQRYIRRRAAHRPAGLISTRQHVGVIGVRRTAGFVRIVADLGAFLMPV